MLTSCLTPLGNFIIRSGYEFDVDAHMVRKQPDNTIVETISTRSPKTTLGMRRPDHLISLKITNMDGEELAEYTPEYLDQLRSILGKKRNGTELWIFTEKGLFLETREIRKKFPDSDERIAYYRSDEAVEDLRLMLKARNGK